MDPLQGKHIPVVPSKALDLFAALADTFREKYKDEKLLLVGFAETATAIGAQAAITVGADYIQTTREVIPGVNYLFFSEEHSHATEQKLVKDDIDRAAAETDRIIFIEDEVTTGKTIRNIISILDREYDVKFKYSVASLLNGMSEENLERYKRQGISLYYLVKRITVLTETEQKHLRETDFIINVRIRPQSIQRFMLKPDGCPQTD